MDSEEDAARSRRQCLEDFLAQIKKSRKQQYLQDEKKQRARNAATEIALKEESLANGAAASTRRAISSTNMCIQNVGEAGRPSSRDTVQTQGESDSAYMDRHLDEYYKLLAVQPQRHTDLQKPMEAKQNLPKLSDFQRQLYAWREKYKHHFYEIQKQKEAAPSLTVDNVGCRSPGKSTGNSSPSRAEEEFFSAEDETASNPDIMDIMDLEDIDDTATIADSESDSDGKNNATYIIDKDNMEELDTNENPLDVSPVHLKNLSSAMSSDKVQDKSASQEDGGISLLTAMSKSEFASPSNKAIGNLGPPPPLHSTVRPAVARESTTSAVHADAALKAAPQYLPTPLVVEKIAAVPADPLQMHVLLCQLIVNQMAVAQAQGIHLPYSMYSNPLAFEPAIPTILAATKMVETTTAASTTAASTTAASTTPASTIAASTTPASTIAASTIPVSTIAASTTPVSTISASTMAVSTMAASAMAASIMAASNTMAAATIAASTTIVPGRNRQIKASSAAAQTAVAECVNRSLNVIPGICPLPSAHDRCIPKMSSYTEKYSSVWDISESDNNSEDAGVVQISPSTSVSPNSSGSTTEHSCDPHRCSTAPSKAKFTNAFKSINASRIRNDERTVEPCPPFGTEKELRQMPPHRYSKRRKTLYKKRNVENVQQQSDPTPSIINKPPGFEGPRSRPQPPVIKGNSQPPSIDLTTTQQISGKIGFTDTPDANQCYEGTHLTGISTEEENNDKIKAKENKSAAGLIRLEDAELLKLLSELHTEHPVRPRYGPHAVGIGKRCEPPMESADKIGLMDDLFMQGDDLIATSCEMTAPSMANGSSTGRLKMNEPLGIGLSAPTGRMRRKPRGRMAEPTTRNRCPEEPVPLFKVSEMIKEGCLEASDNNEEVGKPPTFTKHKQITSAATEEIPASLNFSCHEKSMLEKNLALRDIKSNLEDMEDTTSPVSGTAKLNRKKLLGVDTTETEDESSLDKRIQQLKVQNDQILKRQMEVEEDIRLAQSR